MKLPKSRLIIAAAVMAAVLLGLLIPITVKNAKKRDARQDDAVSGTALPRARQDGAVPPPTLKINGKEEPDVYLQSLDIQVEATGNIASTRYTMVFKNKTDGVLEGELTFPLPDGRAVTYYALDVNGNMREAVPVEKASGTMVFEEIEQRRVVVDPGLLERVDGNNFRTRVYPFPAGGIRTIAIGYVEELALEKDLLRYRLPLAYPAPLEKFSVRATVWKSGIKPLVPEPAGELRFDKEGENYVASFARDNYRPNRALSFALPTPADIPRVVTQPAQGSHYFFASVAPKLETRKKRWSDDLAIIWDVSLSGSQRDLKREMEALKIIFAEKKNATVRLYFLNNKFKKAVNKDAGDGEYKVSGGKWAALKKTLEAAVFDGGTDFSQINLNDVAGNEILFFSDGISTLGDADFIKGTTAIRPIHCVVSSAKADYSVMKLLAGKSKGKFININALSSEELKNELLNETPQFLGTEHGKSVREVYPSIATPVGGDFSAAGISDANDAELTLLFGFGGTVEKRITVKLDAKDAGNHGGVHKLWAQKKIAELDLNYEKNRDELTELGRQFGIVTRNTSLIVLESVNDYIRYYITPPAAESKLYAEYQSRVNGWAGQKRDVVGQFGGVASGATRRGVAGIGYGSGFGGGGGGADDLGDGGPSPAAESAAQRSERTARARERTALTQERTAQTIARTLGGDTLNGAADAAKNITQWWNTEAEVQKPARKTKYPTPDEERSLFSEASFPGGFVKSNDYLRKMTGKTDVDYQTYLDVRKDYANSPAFYFDMANWFHSCGDKETALRVLTSIADLELENASLYRLLGYRLKEFGEYALEKFVCQKVVRWRPMEPQSYRDYALALSDNGEAQAALDSLYGLLTKNYSANIRNRSRGIEEVVVTEINHLLAQNTNLNTSKIYKPLLINIPVDIRVVINWNMNSTDIDLHVKDPNNEECYYGRPKTSAGGRISADITEGYGPEQFLLKKAVKGKYRVYVNYYGDRQVTNAGPSTVMAEIHTKHADKTERRQVVCLQMSNAKRRDDKYVEVAEFEF